MCNDEEFHKLTDGSSKCLACGFVTLPAQTPVRERRGTRAAAKIPGPGPSDPRRVRDIRERFRAARRRQGVVAALYVVAGFLIAASRFGRITENRLYETAIAVPAIGMIVVATALWAVNSRCPACHRFLGRDFTLHVCPKCLTYLG